jgi:hypothetical protein
MALGGFIDQVPTPVYLVIDLIAFLAGIFFARRSFEAGAALLGLAFSLFALAGIVWMTYLLEWTALPFAHALGEVLDLAAFALVFVAAIRPRGARRRDASPPV